MSEEMFYDIETQYDLWDFDKNTQDNVKKAMKEIGFDKWINMDTAFISNEDEKVDILGLDDLMRMHNEVAPSKKFIKSKTQVVLEPFKKNEIKNLILNYKVKYSDTINDIHLSDLVDIDESINFIHLPTNEEFLDLMESIETYGILTPLMVIKYEESRKYTVVSGRSRLAVLNHLYSTTLDKKYLYAPCLVLDPDTDRSMFQGIVISTNLIYL